MATDKFLSSLKEVLIQHKKEKHNFDACGYFETIKQHLDKLSSILSDCERYEINLHFEEDTTNAYTNGKIFVYLWQKAKESETYPTHHYEIELCRDERYWGYCECSPDDPDYNPKYECCGYRCDWVAPSVNVKRVEDIASFSFDGYKKDMWALREKWEEEHRELEELKKQIKIKHIEDQIAELQAKLNELRNT